MTNVFQNWNINILHNELDNYIYNKKTLFPEFLVWYANEDNQLFLLSMQKFYSYACLLLIYEKIKYYKDNIIHNETFVIIEKTSLTDELTNNESKYEFKWIYDLLEEDIEKTKSHQQVIFLYRNHQYFLYQSIPVLMFISFLCGYYLN